jgi:hypothetical protein
MGITTVLKREVQDILIAVRLAADATASAGASYESQAFLQGYHAALDAVSAAMGLELPPSSAGHAIDARWTREPDRVSRWRDRPAASAR